MNKNQKLVLKTLASVLLIAGHVIMGATGPLSAGFDAVILAAIWL